MRCIHHGVIEWWDVWFWVVCSLCTDQRTVMSMFQLSHHEQVRVGVVGNISACHADAPGSIPGHGVSNFFSRRRGFLLSWSLACNLILFFFAQLYNFSVRHPWTGMRNDTLPEWLRGSPAKWVVFDRRGSNPLGVVLGYWRNWKRASLARTRYWDRNPDTPQLCSHGLVGHDARLTRERSRVRASVRIVFFVFVTDWSRKTEIVVMK